MVIIIHPLSTFWTSLKLHIFCARGLKPLIAGIPLSWLQNIPGLSRPPEEFLQEGPSRKPAMFKYSNKQHLGTVSSPPPMANLHCRKTYLLPTVLAIFVCRPKAKNCRMHHVLANFRTFKDQGHFQDFPGPGNIPMKIPELSKMPGNPVIDIAVALRQTQQIYTLKHCALLFLNTHKNKILCQ